MIYCFQLDRQAEKINFTLFPVASDKKTHRAAPVHAGPIPVTDWSHRSSCLT